MPRIPDVELERLKREVSLERLAEGAGIALKRHGADLLGLCPFHNDKAEKGKKGTLPFIIRAVINSIHAPPPPNRLRPCAPPHHPAGQSP